VPLAAGICVLRALVARSCQARLEGAISEERFPLEDKRRERAKTLCKWVVDIPFYSGTAVIGYLLLQDLGTLPWYLGGQGSCALLYPSPLELRPHRGLTLFYVVQCSQHLYSFVAHLFETNPDKFY
jgi:hypothetical protein